MLNYPKGMCVSIVSIMSLLYTHNIPAYTHMFLLMDVKG